MPKLNPYNRRRLSREEIEEGIRLHLDDEFHYERPETRGECVNGPRPCPFVGCRHHLYLTVKNESIRIRKAGEDVTEMEQSCSLDVADNAAMKGGLTLEEVGQVMNITRERARQIEEIALSKLRWRRYAERAQDLEDLLATWDTLEGVKARMGGDDWIFME